MWQDENRTARGAGNMRRTLADNAGSRESLDCSRTLPPPAAKGITAREANRVPNDSLGEDEVATRSCKRLNSNDLQRSLRLPCKPFDTVVSVAPGQQPMRGRIVSPRLIIHGSVATFHRDACCRVASRAARNRQIRPCTEGLVSLFSGPVMVLWSILVAALPARVPDAADLPDEARWSCWKQNDWPRAPPGRH